MPFSLNALTTYGHETVHLERRWQMMGALEALSGILAFGLTTAFLFFQMRRLWPSLLMAAPHQPDHERHTPLSIQERQRRLAGGPTSVHGREADPRRPPREGRLSTLLGS